MSPRKKARTPSTTCFNGLRSETVRSHAPLGRNTEQAEVGDTALFLCSDLARGITGEVIFVDSGYHAMGV